MSQINKYKMFSDKGRDQYAMERLTMDMKATSKSESTSSLMLSMMVDTKLDSFADGHLTTEPVKSIYSGVVSLRNLRLCIFLVQLNSLDVGNACLENVKLRKNFHCKLTLNLASSNPTS